MTIDKGENLYKLAMNFKKITGLGLLLNMSFNCQNQTLFNSGRRCHTVILYITYRYITPKLLDNRKIMVVQQM